MPYININVDHQFSIGMCVLHCGLAMQSVTVKLFVASIWS